MTPNPIPGRFALVHRPLSPVRLQLHPFTLAAMALLALALFGWSAATTSYALFRDDILMRIVSRNAAEQREAAAEISRLRAGVERANSRLLVEREGFAARLDEISRRQAELEKGDGALSGLLAPSAEPGDVSEELRLGSGEPEDLKQSATTARLSERLAALEQRQKKSIDTAQERLAAEQRKLTRTYASLGLSPAAASPVQAGLGGLYIPLGFGGRSQDQMARLQDAAAEVKRLRTGLEGIPLLEPSPGAPEASPFGTRRDPFLGTMAFHSGIDLTAPVGSPAFATASGMVVSAGWSGGYGLMIEVQHTGGYATRYAHLSSVSVAPGQTVEAGAMIGRVGSTGRSTGAHLHYETRLNDQPLDPRRFLTAGKALN